MHFSCPSALDIKGRGEREREKRKWISHLTVADYEIADWLDKWGITIDISVHLQIAFFALSRASHQQVREVTWPIHRKQMHPFASLCLSLSLYLRDWGVTCANQFNMWLGGWRLTRFVSRCNETQTEIWTKRRDAFSFVIDLSRRERERERRSSLPKQDWNSKHRWLAWMRVDLWFPKLQWNERSELHRATTRRCISLCSWWNDDRWDEWS